NDDRVKLVISAKQLATVLADFSAEEGRRTRHPTEPLQGAGHVVSLASHDLPDFATSHEIAGTPARHGQGLIQTRIQGDTQNHGVTKPIFRGEIAEPGLPSLCSITSILL